MIRTFSLVKASKIISPDLDAQCIDQTDTHSVFVFFFCPLMFSEISLCAALDPFFSSPVTLEALYVLCFSLFPLMLHVIPFILALFVFYLRPTRKEVTLSASLLLLRAPIPFLYSELLLSLKGLSLLLSA